MTKHSPEYTRAVQTALGWTFDGTHWWDEHGFQTFDDLPPVTEADRAALARVLVERLNVPGLVWVDDTPSKGFAWSQPDTEAAERFGAGHFDPAGTTPQAWGQALAAADAVGGEAWKALDELTATVDNGRRHKSSAASWWVDPKRCRPDERGGFLCAAIVRATDD